MRRTLSWYPRAVGAIVAMFGLGALGWWSAQNGCDGHHLLEAHEGFVLGASAPLPVLVYARLEHTHANGVIRFLALAVALGYLDAVLTVFLSPILGGDCRYPHRPLLLLAMGGTWGLGLAGVHTFERWVNQPPPEPQD